MLDVEGQNEGVLGRFELLFGGADAVVGRAGVVVSTGPSVRTCSNAYMVDKIPIRAGKYIKTNIIYLIHV